MENDTEPPPANKPPPTNWRALILSLLINGFLPLAALHAAQALQPTSLK